MIQAGTALVLGLRPLASRRRIVDLDDLRVPHSISWTVFLIIITQQPSGQAASRRACRGDWKLSLFEQPVVVVPLVEFLKRSGQLLQRGEVSHPEQLFLEGAEESLAADSAAAAAGFRIARRSPSGLPLGARKSKDWCWTSPCIANQCPTKSCCGNLVGGPAGGDNARRAGAAGQTPLDCGAGLSGAEAGAPDWGILKAARGEGFIITRRCALRPTGSRWPKGAFFPLGACGKAQAGGSGVGSGLPAAGQPGGRAEA